MIRLFWDQNTAIRIGRALAKKEHRHSSGHARPRPRPAGVAADTDRARRAAGSGRYAARLRGVRHSTGQYGLVRRPVAGVHAAAGGGTAAARSLGGVADPDAGREQVLYAVLVSVRAGDGDSDAARHGPWWPVRVGVRPPTDGAAGYRPGARAAAVVRRRADDLRRHGLPLAAAAPTFGPADTDMRACDLHSTCAIRGGVHRLLRAGRGVSRVVPACPATFL